MDQMVDEVEDDLLILLSFIVHMNHTLAHLFCNPYSISFPVLIISMLVCPSAFLMGDCDERFLTDDPTPFLGI